MNHLNHPHHHPRLMKIICAFLILFFLSSGVSFGAGTIELKGKVHGFTEERIELTDGRLIYSIAKAELNTDQQAWVKTLKKGSDIALWVDFKSIKSARNVPQPAPTGRKDTKKPTQSL